MSNHARPRAARRAADQLVGQSRAIQQAREQIGVAARGRFPVWIQGDPGSRKETVGRLIHDRSEWVSGGYFAIDAEVIPTHLLARDLFGADKGAIQGAPEPHEGLLSRMSGGTVLIENTEALPKDVQIGLGAALRSGQAQRVGGMASYSVECRIIGTSAYPLSELTSSGQITHELAEHLSLLQITIPPLRDRREDILKIAAQELEQTLQEMMDKTGQPPAIRGFSREALERLRSHTWPGDEEELREQVRAAARLCTGDELGTEDLMLSWDSSEQIPSFRDAKRNFEHEYVTRVLRMCKGNISRAARIAKKDRKDFYDVMRRNAIDPQDFRG